MSLKFLKSKLKFTRIEIIGILIILPFLFYFFLLDGNTRKFEKTMRKEGNITKAIMIEQDCAYRGGCKIYYDFYYKGKKYLGYQQGTLGNLKIGDTVEIMYLFNDKGKSVTEIIQK